MDYLIYNNNKASVLLAVQIFVGIISVLILYQLPNVDLYYAYVFISFYIITFFNVWNGSGRRINPFILFLLTIGLFIGGRYFSCILDQSISIFELKFYTKYELSHSQKTDLTLYLICFITALSIGYLYSYSRTYYRARRNVHKENFKLSKRIENLTQKVFWPLTIFVLASSAFTLVRVMREGYVSLYLANQTENYSFGLSGLISTIFVIFLGLSYGFCEKNIQKKYLLVFILKSIVSILMGARGAFGCTLLLLIWLYSLTHKISLKKLGLLSIAAFYLLIFIFSFSIRVSNSDTIETSTGTFSFISNFLYGQGISLMVFDVSRSIDTYPTLAYFQSIIPGASFFYSLLTSTPVSPTDNNFSNYLCYSLNPGMYNDGYGLGWTLMSDFYVFGGHSLFGLIIISLLFGWFLGKIIIRSYTNKWDKSLLITIASPLLFLPRGSLNSFATVIIYCLIIYFVIRTWYTQRI